MEHFKNKVVIITGGASGIGRALAEMVSANKTTIVIVADINFEGAKQVALNITSNGGHARAVRLDATKAQDLHLTISEIIKEYGKLDYIFNLVGIGIKGEMQDILIEHWKHILNVNLWSIIYGTIAAYKVMLKQGFGHIINMGSAVGLVPAAPGVPYSAAKFAIVGLSTSLRIEAARYGVKVSVVCPGFVRTNFYKSKINVKKNHREDNDEYWSSRKMINPVDCARKILKGVVLNKSIIYVTTLAYISSWFYRLTPSFFMRFAISYYRRHI